MRILLTGITGYLGSHLAISLISKGFEIIGLKRNSSSLQRISTILNKIVLYNVEEINISDLLNQYGNIDAVIHTATCYGRNNEDLNQLLETNLVFPLKLLDAAKNSNVGLFINTSTILSKNLNPYALSKGQFAEWGQFVSRQKQIRFLNLKLVHFYGQGDDLSKFTMYIIKSCLDNIPEIRLTNGEQKFDFIHINDVVSVYLLLLEKENLLDKGFSEFEVGSGTAVTVREFVETVHRITGSTTQLKFGALPYREGESMLSQADTSLLKSLGWSCAHSLEEGLQMTLEGIKS
jgi:nucleoside-diphosphate-sugar epimerase